MSVLCVGTAGISIELQNEYIIINDIVKLKRPKGCNVNDWLILWNRLDMDTELINKIDADGNMVIDLDELSGN